jgi:hypothetical protein
MSNVEINRYLRGEVLKGRPHFGKFSTGANRPLMYFFQSAEDGDDPQSKYTAEEMLHSVSGIVTDEVLAKFEVMPGVKVKKHFGRYASPVKDISGETSFFDIFMNDGIHYPEYTLRGYSKETLKLVWAKRPVGFLPTTFEEINLQEEPGNGIRN